MKVALTEDAEAILRHFHEITYFSLCESADILIHRGWQAFAHKYGVHSNIKEWTAKDTEKYGAGYVREIEEGLCPTFDVPADPGETEKGGAK